MKIKKKEIFDDYLAMDQTTAIRGILIGIIFLSHLRDYLPFNGPGDGIYVGVINLIGQSMVAPFFFYSGYGIMKSYEKKARYRQGFLEKRLGITWLHFAIAVSIYYIVNMTL